LLLDHLEQPAFVDPAEERRFDAVGVVHEKKQSRI